VIFAAENSNKFPKTRFCKEKSVEDEFTLGPTVQATLVHMISEKETVLLLFIICEQCQANCCREECSLCEEKTIISEGSYTCVYIYICKQGLSSSQNKFCAVIWIYREPPVLNF